MMLTDLFRGNLLALEVRALMIAAACMSLAGCPGRSGSPQVEQPPVVVQPPPPVPEPSAPPPDAQAQAAAAAKRRRESLATKEIGFFYSDWDQMLETLGWVTFVHVAQSDQYGLNLIARAIEVGHKRIVITLEDCGFIGKQRAYRGSFNARASIRDFLTKLVEINAINKVVAIYTADEPNLHGRDISDADMASFCADIRAVAIEFGLYAPLWVIYGADNDDRPGLGNHDVVGADPYGGGLAGALAYTNHLGLAWNQHSMLVPACASPPDNDASPWQETPAPWVEAMLADDQCTVIFAFDWCGYDGNTRGLRNGPAELRQAWIDAGYEIVAAHDGS